MTQRRFKQLRRGMAIVPKQTHTDSTVLWVGLCASPTEVPSGDHVDAIVSVDARSAGGVHVTHPVRLTRYAFVGDDELTFFHGHVRVGDLPPATKMVAEARLSAVAANGDGGPDLDTRCSFSTLPTALGTDPFRIVVASCFDIDNDADQQIPGLCQRLFADEYPDITLLVGDQVYLDAPWRQFRSRTSQDPRHFYLTKYWSAWGRGVDQHGGLAPLLTVGGNWFLPDDHEFWNNFPHATPFALHSYRNWPHILRARFDRTRARIVGGKIPDKLVEAPSPNEWDTWSRAAFELFGSFQTPAPDLAVSAGAADDQGSSPPLPSIVQHTDLGQVRLIMVDTRTRRSRSAKAGGSTFMPRADFDRLMELAAGPELVLLALAQPVFQPPTDYRGIRKQVKAFLDLDRGIENYRIMYPEFWRRLTEARAGLPTVFIGGDVHHNEVALAPSLAMAQVVSSPMSLVTGLAEFERARAMVFGKAKRIADVDVGQLVPGRHGTVQRLVPFMSDKTEGLCTLDLTHDERHYSLRIEHHPRDQESKGFLFVLTIDPFAPDIEQRIRQVDVATP